MLWMDPYFFLLKFMVQFYPTWRQSQTQTRNLSNLLISNLLIWQLFISTKQNSKKKKITEFKIHLCEMFCLDLDVGQMITWSIRSIPNSRWLSFFFEILFYLYFLKLLLLFFFRSFFTLYFLKLLLLFFIWIITKKF